MMPVNALAAFNKYALSDAPKAEVLRINSYRIAIWAGAPQELRTPCVCKRRARSDKCSNAKRRKDLKRSAQRQQPLSENGMGRPARLIVPTV